jgi:hypothetical protein
VQRYAMREYSLLCEDAAVFEGVIRRANSYVEPAQIGEVLFQECDPKCMEKQCSMAILLDNDDLASINFLRSIVGGM